MEQKLFESCDFLLLTENCKSRLYKVKDYVNGDPFELQPLDFLPDAQPLIEVYPEAGLIITQDSVYTLNGKILYEHEKAKISIIKIPDESKWMIVQDHMYDIDSRYRITIWNGNQEFDYMWGRKMVQNERYFALYTLSNNCWCIYTKFGDHTFDLCGVGDEIVMQGDFLLLPRVGNYMVYSMCDNLFDYSAETHLVFQHQHLVKCSQTTNFAICANLLGAVQTYYNGKFKDFGRAEMIELYDKAGIFSLKRNGKYFLYDYKGDKFAENIAPLGADLVAYNEKNNTLLVGVNGVFRLIKI